MTQQRNKNRLRLPYPTDHAAMEHPGGRGIGRARGLACMQREGAAAAAEVCCRDGPAGGCFRG